MYIGIVRGYKYKNKKTKTKTDSTRDATKTFIAGWICLKFMNRDEIEFSICIFDDTPSPN